ncbi:tetratricopeptide repeat protein [Clostridium sp. MCC353]|uniref:tetratricopeptide repeat protein n=1 Tax=Clostridium sp. MCC353 TaxID=2592646 RepID=UPI001C0130F6|nr:tetratricopeptide repeat protein [Clostridium sp. MCC353]MBT9775476.1 tetratricopeptide repeat protein [Clostridium sp. MCC353]
MEQLFQYLDSLFAQGRTNEVEPWLCRQIELAKQERDEDTLTVLLSELGGFYRGSGRLEESEQALKRAVGLEETRNHDKGISFAVLLINLAGTLRMEKQTKEALELFERAEDILNVQGETGYRLASLYNNRSLVYQDMGRLEEALKELQKALAIIEGCSGCGEELAVTYVNLALLLGSLNRGKEEEEAVIRALALFEDIDHENDPHYAAALSALGGILYKKGELEQSLDAYNQALQMIYRLFGRSREYEMISANIAMISEQAQRKGSGADERSGTGQGLL